jgi:pyruvate ferredoxin oxidoreductase gamma subunit
MLEIRIHGRGGQGNVVAAYLLASAAFEVKQYCQAFPNFGAERRGAPVMAFVRIARNPIRQRNQVLHPAFLIVQDEALLQIPEVLAGLQPNGGILINSNKSQIDLPLDFAHDVVCLPATRLAQEVLGRPVPNTALLSAFLSLTDLLPHDALEKALQHRFKGKVLDKNLQLIEQARSLVEANRWTERLESLYVKRN